METLLPSFKLGFGEVIKLSFLVDRTKSFETVRCFATLGKSLWLDYEDAPRATETSRPQANCHAYEKVDPRRPESVCKRPEDGTPPNSFWRKFRAKAAPPSKEEFWSLRNDDFSRKKKSLPRIPFPVERTEGSEILFGIAPCSLALARSKRTFFQLFLKSARGVAAPAMEAFSRRAEDRGIPVKLVRRTVLDRLCCGGVHQGVCLEATPLRPIGWQEGPSHQAEGAAAKEAPRVLWLALEGIQDPMNLGAVLRSAHFLGIDGIVMSQKDSCPLTPVVSKASSGAMEVLDVFGTDDLQSLLKTKSKEGWEVLGTVAHAKAPEDVPVVSCLDFRWTKPTVLVLGNEGRGLSLETRCLCQKMLTISPGRELEPGIESLNVSVAAGILLHSICAQKTKTDHVGGSLHNWFCLNGQPEDMPYRPPAGTRAYSNAGYSSFPLPTGPEPTCTACGRQFGGTSLPKVQHG